MDKIPSEVPEPMTSQTSLAAYWLHERSGVFLGLSLTAASIASAILGNELLYLVIGGSVLSLAGIPLTFLRLIRRGPAGVDDPMPLPTVPVGGAVQFNPHFLSHSLSRLSENFGVATGVAYLMMGTFLSGVVAPIAQLIRN